MAKTATQVHYVSPFGSPAYMTRERADVLLARDDATWELLSKISDETGCDVIGRSRRLIGPPRIEGIAL